MAINRLDIISVKSMCSFYVHLDRVKINHSLDIVKIIAHTRDETTQDSLFERCLSFLLPFFIESLEVLLNLFPCFLCCLGH